MDPSCWQEAVDQQHHDDDPKTAIDEHFAETGKELSVKTIDDYNTTRCVFKPVSLFQDHQQGRDTRLGQDRIDPPNPGTGQCRQSECPSGFFISSARCGPLVV